MQLRSSRRRHRDPDWDAFYKNGVPKEVIVIHDSPEPASSTSGSQTLLDYNGAANGTAATSANTRKRKHADVSSQSSTRSLGFARGLSNRGPPSDLDLTSDRGVLHSTTISRTRPSDCNSTRAIQKRQPALQDGTSASSRRKPEAYSARGGLPQYRGLAGSIVKASEVRVRVVRDDMHRDKKIKVDDDDGHYIVVPDTELASQYRIVRLLGQGTFGKVVEAVDRKTDKPVAVKVIRSVQKYRDAAKIELRALKTLRENDAENRFRCIHLRDCFDFRGHICIVTDLLGLSLFDFLKANNFVPFPNSHIQSFARQLLTSIAFLHDLNLIHTDLKPENVLLCDSAYQTFTYNRKIPSSQIATQRHASQRRVLLSPEIRLIDFGSATFQDEFHSSVVSTRHYRAPEIILGLGWSFPCDIWSIGCILVEFYTGDALFQTHDNLEHLAMLEAVCDAKISPHLIQKVKDLAPRTGQNSAAKYFNLRRKELDYPTRDTTRASRRFVKNMKRLDDIIPHTSSRFMKTFLDLLKKIFVYDPAARITAKEALEHPWFKEVAHDDGTEAARLHQERTAAGRSSGTPSTHHSSRYG
ncbi:hypothetical protein VTK73DRAFT_2157 [Phialemonium thermophilum]|uniref:Protein kinase domain-containing protein n=1 Tax=Phialemonium thermophilum TaxID=223376 RepID=A0ABR3X697_9PEZI